VSGAGGANGQRDVDEADVVSVMDTVMAGALDVACAMGVVAVAMVTGMADVAHGNRTGRPGASGHARRSGPLRRSGHRPGGPAHARPGRPAYDRARRAPYGTYGVNGSNGSHGSHATTAALPRRRAALSRAAHGICVQAARRGGGA
jgi:hypothetical protein